MRALLCALLAALALAVAAVAPASAAEPAMCGGFVKVSAALSSSAAASASSAAPAVDYSKVHVHLHTAEGLLKYSTECAPNGYYFIPVYEQGSFRLRIEGPPGWNFLPAEAEVNLGAGSDDCASDIDFEFTGFSLGGRVAGPALSSCAAEGPQGVRADLAPKEGGKPVASAVSDASGAFAFPGVLPRAYAVRASHASWKLSPARQDVEVGFANAELPAPFEVAGYALDASVTAADGAAAVAGVDVFLFAEGEGPAPACAAPAKAPAAPAAGARAVCQATTDQAGRVRFEGLPCGSYHLVPQYKRDLTEFVVRPASLAAQVGHGDLAAAEPFRVVGFTAAGRVVDTDGAGVEGARVSVNGEARAVTGADGRYTLDGVTEAAFEVAVLADGLFFEPLRAVRLTPLAAAVPDAVVARVRLCGRVGTSGAGRRVALSGAASGAAETDASGAYCFEVAPGREYVVRPEQSAEERASGVRLAPAERRVPVGARPVLHADFSQARVVVQGRVVPLEGVAAGPGGVAVRLALQPEGPGTYVGEAKAAADGSFEFRGVFPGTYRVTASHPGWCWRSGAGGAEVRVEADDVSGVELRQAGFRLEADVAAATEARLAGPEGVAERTVSLAAGPNELCVERAGVYHLSPSGCFRFGGADSFDLDTAAPRPLRLAVSEARVCGRVEVPQAGEASLPATLEVRTAGAAEPRAVAALVGGSAYQYCVWAAPGAAVAVSVPVSPEAGLLFRPRQRDVRVPAAGCPAEVESFRGGAGRYYEGSVTPAVAGVRIVVRAEGEDEPLLSVETGEDGAYRAGPLYDDGSSYTVAAESEDYHFVEKDGAKGHFKAMRLARVTVRVRDEDGAAVPAVLLSLSGHGGYRHNSATEGSGDYSFAGLFPGAYFLRPLLKEYEFSPKQVSLEVAEAATEVVEVRATRVAWSARGRVRALNGEAEPRVVVEARRCDEAGECRPFDETTTDNAGDFRLRGLVPGDRYEVAVKAPGATSNAHVDHASPAAVAVSVDGRQDARGLEFVAFGRPEKFDVTGAVASADLEHLDTLAVELCRAATPATPVKTAPVSSALPFFEFSGVPAGEYVVRAKTSLSRHTHHFEQPEARVVLDGAHASVRLAFEARPKVAEEDQLGRGNLLSLFAFAGVVMLALNWESVAPVVERLRGGSGAAAAPAPADAAPQSRGRSKKRR